MADSKISDLTSAGALTGTEEVVIVQSSSTVKTTTQDIADLGGGNTIYSADDTVTDNARVVTLAGSTAGQYINFNTGGGNAIIQFNGSRQILVPSATEYKYSGAGTHNVTLGGNLSTDKINFRTAGGTTCLDIRGNGYTYAENILFVGANSTTQGALRVYGKAGASSQIFNVYNNSSVVIHEFRQSVGAAEFNMKDASGTNQFRVITNSNDMLQLGEARNIMFGTTTGTKIGSATSQKLAFWNATPVVQPTTGITAGAFVANTSGIADDTATFDGYTIGQIAAALRQIGILA
jgi:hypothetical protein